MKAVFYLKKWFDLPQWGVSITEYSIFGKMVFDHYSNKVPSGVYKI